MMYLLLATIIVAWCALAMWLLIWVVDNPEPKHLIIGAAFVIATLTVIFNATGSSNSKGPCVSYETQMYYNAATKTMMPARVCVLRGEWINEAGE